MKLSVALLFLASSVAAQDGKKGGGMSLEGGKKGMSMMMEEGRQPAVFCNSGSLRCARRTQNCAEGVSNFMVDPRVMVVDTDACEAFCAASMVSDDYFIQLTPDATNNQNLCQCFEKCAEWEDIASNPSAFVNLFSVGDNACSDIAIGSEEFCDGAASQFCEMNSCTGNKKPQPIPFSGVTEQADCAARCSAVDRDIFALNTGSNSCFCLESCPTTGNVGGMTTVYSLVAEDGSNMCDQVGINN